MIEVSNKCDLEIQLRQNERTLALFYASWCPYCRSFLPIFTNISSNQGDSSTLRVKVDDYDNPLWNDYAIQAVPTVILFDQGNVVSRLDGRFGYGLSEQQFKEWLERLT